MQKNSYRLGDLAEQLGAQLQGDPEFRVDGLASIEHAQISDITFVSGKAYLKYLVQTSAGAVLLRPEWVGDYTGNCLLLQDPYWGYARLSGLFSHASNAQPGIHPTAVVAATATIAPSASIGPHCVIDAEVTIGAHTELAAGVYVGARTTIGESCRLYPNVTIYHDVSIANAVTIHSATVIGSDGFGYAPCAEGWEKIHQLGGVVIASNVEIGSGCTLDRGALTDTVIEQGVIIDNQVHIAHNVRVGEFTAIAGCCGIAGSTEIGAHCLLGGSVNISGHLKIADHVQFNGASVVTKSIREPGIYSSGTPLQPAKQWQKNAVRFGHLNELFDRVKQLEDGESQRD